MRADLTELMTDRVVVDLSVEYFPGMPYIPATPAFQYGMTKEHGDQVLTDGLSSAADQVLIHTHSGTHIDALCHYAKDGKLHGGASAREVQSKLRGSTVHGVDLIPPIVRRGVLLDVTRALRKTRLDPGTEIGPTELAAAEELAGCRVQQGDVTLVRTGEIQLWPDQEFYSLSRGGIPGLTLEGAQWLSGRGVFAIGCDNYPLEVIPAPKTGRRAGAMPVHGHLLVEKGIYIIEVMNLEELSSREAGEFVFVTLPLRLRGATGCPVRPIALV